MPERPEWFTPVVSKFTNVKLPAFFEYAKDKEKAQVQKRNGSFVNKIFDRIPNKPINTRGLKLGQIDYQVMMSNSKIICSKEVSDLYDELNKQYRYMINMKDEYADNLRYVACKIREQFSEFGYSDETLTDMLIEYLYGRDKRYKQLLWFCYGQYVVNNIEKNLKDRGEYKNTKYVQCIDCGKWFEVDIKDNKACRCLKCQQEHRRTYQRELMRKRKNLAQQQN